MVYIVIPAYNEEKTIYSVVKDVLKKYKNVIVVDDGSSDNTLKSAKRAGADVIRHIVNRGQGAALRTGIEYALKRGAEIIVMFDADGQHSVEDIKSLIVPIASKKVDVVLGSRFLGNMSNATLDVKIRLKLALIHQWFFTGLKVTDASCGLRAFSRKAAESIVINQDRMAHAVEIIEKIAKLKIKYVEVPVNVKYTKYSLSKGQKSFKGSLKVLYEFFIGRVVK